VSQGQRSKVNECKNGLRMGVFYYSYDPEGFQKLDRLQKIQN